MLLKLTEALAKVGVILAIVLIMSLVFAFPVKWLWNYLMPELFALKEISLWQALAMNMLAGFLFKSNSSSSKSE